MEKTSFDVMQGDGNAFAIMSRVRAALKYAGKEQDVIEKYMNDATSGDYDNLLVVSMQYLEEAGYE